MRGQIVYAHTLQCTTADRGVSRVVVFNRSYLDIVISHSRPTIRNPFSSYKIIYENTEIIWFFKGRWYFFLTHPVYYDFAYSLMYVKRWIVRFKVPHPRSIVYRVILNEISIEFCRNLPDKVAGAYTSDTRSVSAPTLTKEPMPLSLQ